MRNFGLSSDGRDAGASHLGRPPHEVITQRDLNLINFPINPPAQSLLDEIQEAESRLDDLELGTRVFLIICAIVFTVVGLAILSVVRALREGAFGW